MKIEHPHGPGPGADADLAAQQGDLSSPAEAFRTLLLAAAHRLHGHVRQALGEDDTTARFAFLVDYSRAFAGGTARAQQALAAWSDATGWPGDAVALWMAFGLVEEDARFGDVFEALDPQGRSRGPSLALLQAWWGTMPGDGVGPALRHLLERGLLQACNPGAARADLVYEVQEACWLAARGEAPQRPWRGVRLAAPAEAPEWHALVLPPAAERQLGDLAPLLAAGPGTLLVRGPQHNGRHSVLCALARAEGRASLLIDWPLPDAGPGHADAPAWLGAFATLTGARPIVRVQATPGEALRLPALHGASGWTGVACGDDDAFDGLDGAVWSLALPLPDAALRRALIEAQGGAQARAVAAELADVLHMSSGHLVRALQHDVGPQLAAAEQAQRLRESALASGSAALASLAQRLDTPLDALDLVVDADLRADLAALQARCQQRERLREPLPRAVARRLNGGVRALFAGPSGTGKTLAAQWLAAQLRMPLFRLDLSSVVSKYIGETERNLQRVLSAAEALDVVLLLDEGDALLARRTEVGNAHDRYANLETSFLLQRLESHRGLVLVTTNALDRVDGAFLRRFDHLLHFRAPELPERLALWRAHLPERHRVTPERLLQVAEGCALSGGQIRNVALAAASAALAAARVLDDALFADAVRREYRRSGSLCPLGRA